MEADLAEEVHEPKFYFDAKEEKADLALDYLLMTSGWRRFAWKAIEEGQPMTNIAGEQAIIAGKVIGKDGFPLDNTVLSIPNTNFSQQTDKDGRFLF